MLLTNRSIQIKSHTRFLFCINILLLTTAYTSVKQRMAAVVGITTAAVLQGLKTTGTGFPQSWTIMENHEKGTNKIQAWENHGK